MVLHLKKGIDKAVFGMKEKDIKEIYGNPTRQFTDDEDNVIYLYSTLKARFTFYKEENGRLGYIISANPGLELLGKKIIGRQWADVQKDIAIDSKDFEKETYDTTDNYFNEANWVIFQVEFDEVVKVEVGAVINSKDEFEWQFKG